MRKLVLFDIDGTLVLTGGAGLRAMNRACEELVGHPEALAGIPVAGRTDRVILTDVVRRINRDLDEALLVELRDRYVERLAEEIHQRGRGVNGVLPGIRDLLDALAARDDVFLGLLTGNFEAGARIKLEHFDLWRYFRCGAFADDASDRNALVPFALERARISGLALVEPAHILVVGDTPYDVACAKAVSATAVGVATGGFSMDDLRVSGADVVFADLWDTAGFVRLLED
jgi:phosphoglycolate phosphatase-like HAD superfamily hydrolase